MNTLAVLCMSVFAVASGGLLVPSAKILQGPSSRTTIVGPDGSAISAFQPGGQVFTDDLPGVVAHAAPLFAPQPVLRAAPVLVQAAPYAAAAALEGQYVPDYTEKLYDDGSYKPELSPVPLAASPLGLTVAGSGLEGQYVHDNTEKLFDDGSYKPEYERLF